MQALRTERTSSTAEPTNGSLSVPARLLAGCLSLVGGQMAWPATAQHWGFRAIPNQQHFVLIGDCISSTYLQDPSFQVEARALNAVAVHFSQVRRLDPDIAQIIDAHWWDLIR